MILAAGLGVRMRPLTDDRPKALVELAGTTLLDRALAKCRAAGISSIVINTHYKGEQIHARYHDTADIVLSPEDELLETGGGVCKALPYLADGPFIVVNCDSVWADREVPALQRLSDAWRDQKMDGLLLMQPVERAIGYDGRGDFTLTTDGRIVRRGKDESAPLVFMGVQVLHPRLFEAATVARYSLNKLYDRALAAGRLYGLVHDGDWYHVGTPEDLILTEHMMDVGSEPAGGLKP